MKNAVNIHKALKQNKMINAIIVAGIIIIVTLFFFIPYITEQYTIKSIVNHSKNSVQQIKLTRAYYVDTVVGDIKKFAPNIEFHHNHWGVNGKIPLPTTTIRDLSKIFSDKTGLKYSLYSDYPFSHLKDRVLTQFQKDAIKYTQKNKDGIYIKREILNGEEVLRVATTDYMTDQACVNCHNSHPGRTWEKNKWKLGDSRGVLEVITPMGPELENHAIMRNYIIFFVIMIFSIVLLYLSSLVIKRENALLAVADELESEVDDKTKELQNLHHLVDKYVISSKTDTQGNITYVSQAFVDMCEYSKEELVGHPHNIVRHIDMPKEVFLDMWKTIKRGKTWRGEILNKKKYGGFYWVDAIISPEYDKNKNIIGFNAVRHDITSKKDADYLARHDYLTKLPNRAHFEEILAHALKLAEKNNTILAVLFIDFDNFKNINDTLGHQAGDKVLKNIGERIRLVLSEIDTIARIGGDEFIILLEDIKNKTSILNSVNNLLEIINKPMKIDSNTLNISVSIGISIYPDDGDTVLDLMKNADNAMYHVKEFGKNSYKFYTKDIMKAMKRRLEIEKALIFAIDNDTFTLVYQPKYNILTQEVVGCEALLRLEDKNIGSISPVEFIKIAEENRMIIPIGELVFQKACKAFSQWKEMNLPIDTISINISSIQLEEKSIVDRLTQIVEESNIKPQNIDLELTEHTIMHQTEKNIDILKQLRTKGFQISIDDFGTGYSSMSYLTKLPIDIIKIDKVFIDQLHVDKNDASIAKAIITIAQSFGYKVLAEGIEKKIQEDILLGYNCDLGQGYLYSKGLIFNDFVVFLKDKINS